ncbi:thioredoxin domain-containing protein [Marinobacterium marinum]|uniref:Thioredoxin-like fold domain-containing protein n=1 Tax=Marinobacterium marinum TaxID=2756129 RepID=A0A7W1WXB3_9GAMM|nr:hypothetical protein [Marinobacterium marinum]MBA4501948.1 hypothetical protein [Marinobacterium marinum]
MKLFFALLLILPALPAKAAETLPYFTGFEPLRAQTPAPQILVLLFSQPECVYCDLVRGDFLLPIHRKQQSELIVRELKVPGAGMIKTGDHQPETPSTFAQRYGIKFFPSVLMLGLDGMALGEPLVGISSRDFYGYYLDQAIEQALMHTQP